MFHRTALFLAVLIVISGFAPLITGQLHAQEEPTVPVKDLEAELSGLENELSDLEKQIDILLEDLVDPKLTSLSVFFTSQNIQGQVPTAILLKLGSEPLANREFGETDRLILVRGGAIEVYSGIAEPSSQALTVECFLSSGSPQDGTAETVKTTFKLETRRAMANYLEISLSEDTAGKPANLQLSARHWFKEP